MVKGVGLGLVDWTGESGNKARSISQRRRAAIYCYGLLARILPKLPFYLVTIGVGGLLVAAVGVIIYQSNIGSKEPPTAPASVRIDAFAELPVSVVNRLHMRSLEKPATFKVVYGGDPADLCRAISALGFKMSKWEPHPLRDTFWQCVSGLSPIGREDSEGRRTTLFVNLRGESEDKLDLLRIKLNGESPASLPRGKRAALRVMEVISARYGWDLPRAFYDAVRNGTLYRGVDQGIRLSVLPEDPLLQGDTPDVLRLNISFAFPKIDLMPDAYHFAPFQWRLPDPETPLKRREGASTGDTRP